MGLEGGTGLRSVLSLRVMLHMMRPTHTPGQNLTDALVWLFGTIVCAAIFSVFASFFFGGIIEDGGWPSKCIGASVWILAALCATIDVRHRRRKRQIAHASDSESSKVSQP